ncbi:hypothetical protein BC830DRAFT_752047 [Chytriomyces sp. MP71]|nr:hypothetical protein BC830DRAFT_752047 [Chytriomyces sp. MP71]
MQGRLQCPGRVGLRIGVVRARLMSVSIRGSIRSYSSVREQEALVERMAAYVGAGRGREALTVFGQFVGGMVSAPSGGGGGGGGRERGRLWVRSGGVRPDTGPDVDSERTERLSRLEQRAFSLVLRALEQSGDKRALDKALASLSRSPLSSAPTSSTSATAAPSSTSISSTLASSILAARAVSATYSNSAASSSSSSSRRMRKTQSLADSILANNDPSFSASEISSSIHLRVAVAHSLLASRNHNDALLALQIIQSCPVDIFQHPTLPRLVVRALASLKAYPEIVTFLASSQTDFGYAVWAEAVAGVDPHTPSPALALARFKKMLSLLSNQLTRPDESAATHGADASTRRKDEAELDVTAIVAATRTLMKTLADFCSLEDATAIFAEAGSIFRHLEASATANSSSFLRTVDTPSFLFRSLQAGYLDVLLNVLTHGTRPEALAKHGMTLRELTSMADQYIQNMTAEVDAIVADPTFTPGQDICHSILAIQRACIPLAPAEFTIPAALDLFDKMTLQGYTPRHSDFHALFVLLSRPYIPTHAAKKSNKDSDGGSGNSNKRHDHPLDRSERLATMSRLLESMERSGIRLSPHTYTHLYTACGPDHRNRRTALPQLRAFEAHARTYNIPLTRASALAQTRTRLLSGDTENGFATWAAFPFPRDTAAYTTVFRAAAAGTSLAAARYALSDILPEMDRAGVPRDPAFCFAVARCALAARDLVAARTLVREMRHIDGRRPDARVYGCVSRLTFADVRTARVFGPALILEMRADGVRVRASVLREAVEVLAAIGASGECWDALGDVVDFGAERDSGVEEAFRERVRLGRERAVKVRGE